MTKCLICPIGAHCDGDTGADSFTLCPSGTFISAAGSALGACEECETGKISAAEGSSECQSCTWTEYASDAKNECKTCFDPAIGLGFQRPSECLVIWALVGGLLAICFCCAIQARYCAAWCGNEENSDAISVAELNKTSGDLESTIQKADTMEMTDMEGPTTTSPDYHRKRSVEQTRMDRERATRGMSTSSTGSQKSRRKNSRKKSQPQADLVQTPQLVSKTSYSKPGRKHRKKRGPKDNNTYEVVDSPHAVSPTDVPITMNEEVINEPVTSGGPSKHGGLPKVDRGPQRPPQQPEENQSLLSSGDNFQAHNLTNVDSTGGEELYSD